ncbi:protein of unknown function (plasmid) [Azospirillum baldaniorum]|uniref:Uncharacterized protein n=1 Tax=Azospirillum baldaniorum TaxID=1064539 RepID=A0A9P1K0D1_9PROT|nr:protein of unknown function [Azospirillum baldaniorum]
MFTSALKQFGLHLGQRLLKRFWATCIDLHRIALDYAKWRDAMVFPFN